MRTKKKTIVVAAPVAAAIDRQLGERGAPSERRVSLDTALTVMTKAQLQILLGNTPDYAIKHRPGRGGKTFSYLEHGYVTDKLNEAFGFDWDHRLLPVFNGCIYQLTVTKEERVDKKTGGIKVVDVRNVAVYGELTVRIRNPKTTEVIATVTKCGAGSQNWEDTIEFGDVIKGATSDSIKVCAMRLGIGLDLYWDDQAELIAHQDAHPVGADGQPRKTIADLITETGLTIDAILQKTGVSLADLTENGYVKDELLAKLYYKGDTNDHQTTHQTV